MKVLKTYFDNDFTTFTSYFAQTLYTLEGEGPIPRTEAKKMFKDKEYLVDEDYTVYSIDEYEKMKRIIFRQGLAVTFISL